MVTFAADYLQRFHFSASAAEKESGQNDPEPYWICLLLYFIRDLYHLHIGLCFNIVKLRTLKYRKTPEGQRHTDRVNILSLGLSTTIWRWYKTRSARQAFHLNIVMWNWKNVLHSQTTLIRRGNNDLILLYKGLMEEASMDDLIVQNRLSSWRLHTMAFQRPMQRLIFPSSTLPHSPAHIRISIRTSFPISLLFCARYSINRFTSLMIHLQYSRLMEKLY